MPKRRPTESSAVRTPSALLGEPGDALIAYLANGHSLPDAAKLAGVNLDTVRWWLLRGGYSGTTSRHRCPPHLAPEPYRGFATRVAEAVASGKTVERPGPLRGRKPSPISAEQRETLLTALQDGLPWNRACRLAGVSLSTFQSWLRLGGFPRRVSIFRAVDPAHVAEPYKSFADAVLAAEEAWFGE